VTRDGSGTGCPLSRSPSMWKAIASRISRVALLQRRASRDAAGEIGRVRGEVDVITALDHDQIAPLGHRSSEIPACLTMLAQVFG
jgi:hypothetical protein